MKPDRRKAYQALRTRLEGTPSSDSMDDRLDAFIEAAWSHLQGTGVSWIGFYLRSGSGGASLELGPCRDRPACSPIGVHGVCGQSFLTGLTRIVPDVLELGPDYVACDPRDRSEIVIPIRMDSAGDRPADAVLDLDSFELDSFSDEDDLLLRDCLLRAGLEPSTAGPSGSDLRSPKA